MFIQGINGGFGSFDVDGNWNTNAVTQPHPEFLNTKEGKVWALDINAIDPVGAADKFFYFENTGSLDIKIHSIRLSSTVAGFFTVKKVTGTPTFTAGNDVTPVSFNTNKSPVVSATIKTDTDTTGLTDAGIWERISLATANVENHIDIESTIIIGPGGCMALEWSAATGALSGTIIICQNA